jgi:biopolymer transport protein ExbB
MRRVVLCAAILLVAAAAVPAEEPSATGGVITGERMSDMFHKGGVLMWPILLCSVVALAVVFERLVTLRTAAVFPRKLLRQVRDMVRENRIEEAVDLCRGSRAPLARLIQACLIRADASGFEMEAALEEAGGRVLYDLRKNGRPLGVIADVAPLLGLMGTVLGMIKAFDVVAKTGALGRAEMLAEGIGEALLTTAFGLSVAIPALIFYQYFRGKADGLLRAMEDASLEILADLRKRRRKP